MLKQLIFPWLVLVVLFFSASHPIDSRAQDVPDQEIKKEEKKDVTKKKEALVTIENVTVTATRTEKNIMDVPSNIQIITKEEIEKMNPIKITDVLQQLPGVFFTDTGTEPQISIRGTRTDTSSSGAYVMIDGIPIQMGRYGFSELEGLLPGSVEKIEVVKGPLSSLYGGDAAQGVINIFTKKGQGKTKVNVSSMFGSYGDRRYSASATGATNKVDYSASINRREYDGYRYGATYDGINFLGNLGYSIDDFSRLSLLCSINDLDRYSPVGISGEEKAEDRRQTPYVNEQEITDVITGLSYDRDTEDYLAKVSLYYKDRDRTRHYNKVKEGSSDPDKYKYIDNVDEWIGGLKSQFGIKTPVFGRANMLILGLDADWDNLTNMRHYLVPSTSHTSSTNKGSGDFNRDLYGIFMQDEFQLSDSLTVTLGGRYDIIKYDFQFLDSTYDSSPEFEKFSPKAGLSYRFTDKNSAYLSYSSAYRPGTMTNYITNGYFDDLYDYTLEPERHSNFELGYRQYFNNSLFLDVNLFYTELEDEIYYYYIDGSYSGNRNYGETTHIGAEATISGTILSQLDYQLSYSYLKTEVLEGKTKTMDLEGKEVARAPHHTLTVMLDYPLFKNDFIGVDWHFDARMISSYYQDQANTQKYGGYGLANTRLDFTYKWITCFVGVNNLFDKEYDGYAGSDTYSPRPGRTYVGGLCFEL